MKKLLLLMILLLSFCSLVYAEGETGSSDVNVYVDMDSVVDELEMVRIDLKDLQDNMSSNMVTTTLYMDSISKYTMLSFLVISILSGYYIGYSLGHTKIGR